MFYDLLSECGANYEHAPAEGPPIVALIDHVVEYT